MNREVKFRAWDIEYKTMYFDVCPFGSMVLIPTDEDKLTTKLCGIDVLPVRNKKVELMQYTGLKAINGEIYEGDIIRYYFMEEPRIGKVSWVNSGYVIDEGNTNLPSALIHPVDQGEAEVIGNIYEHPQLLEVK